MMLVDMTFCRVSKECILEYIVILALVHFSPMAGSFNTTTTTESMKNTSSPSSCVVPAYSQPLFEVNATEENTKLFLTEGMCYLLCLQVVYEESYSTVKVYPVWPFPVVDDDCTDSVSQVHECTRGCRIFLQKHNMSKERNTSLCTDECNNECREECGGDMCVNPDSIDLWIARSGCTNDCIAATACNLGCLYAEALSTDKTQVPPPPPLAPPTLVDVSNHSDANTRKGLFSTNLTDASGARNRTEGGLFAFLFLIHDLDTRNATYIWQHDPREPLDLSSHICRTVNVSLAIVNYHSRSQFSAATQVFISEDPQRIPNPPLNLMLSDSMDMREGFLQYVIINITWQLYHNDRYLMYYEVVFTNVSSSSSISNNQDGCEAPQKVLYKKAVAKSSEGLHTVLVEGDGSFQYPLMEHTYLVMVTSVGDEGNRSSCDIITARSLNDFRDKLLTLDCERELSYTAADPPKPYFTFHFDWVVSHLVVNSGFLKSFNLTGLGLVAFDFPEMTTRLHMFESPLEIAAIRNQTSYQYNETRYSRSVSIPVGTVKFIFDLTFNWEPPLLISSAIEPFSCRLDVEAPPPSEVRNWNVTEATVHSNEAVRVQAHWQPPAQPNGILTGYKLCLSSVELVGSQLTDSNSSCIMIGNVTFVEITIHYSFNLGFQPDLYIQIQAISKRGTSGLWSGAYMVPLMMTADQASRLSDGAIIGITLALLLPLIVSLVACLFIVFIRNMHRKSRLFNLSDTMPNLMPMLRVSTASASQIEKNFMADFELLNTAVKDEWELCPSDITVNQMMGEGAFGEVYRGFLKGPLNNVKVKAEFRNAISIPVAIKLLKDTTKGSERRDFITEIDMMKKVSENHNPHVVSMLGCVATQEPVCLVTEFVDFGDLLSYLRSSRQMYVTGLAGNEKDPYIKLGKLKPTDLPSFSYQIAAGMAYLSSIGIVHRDLACRNVLVNADKALKITDFGMSREVEEMYVQQSTGRVPYKWMALESILAREFTSASDVWSYGIVLWEISTIGGVPYPGVHNADLIPLLKTGTRMEKPENCSDEIYDIMLECWREDPNQRPEFEDLKSKFSSMLLEVESYVDFDNINPNQLCYQEDEEFNLDLTEDDFELPAVSSFMDVLSPDRRPSVPITSLQHFNLDQRRSSTPTTRVERSDSRKVSFLNKIKNKFLSLEEEGIESEENSHGVPFNLEMSPVESTMDRYVSSPTASNS